MSDRAKSERPQAEGFAPGEYAMDELEARGIDVATFAKLMKWTPDECQYFISGEKRMLASEAERLGQLFGTNPITWLNLDRSWRKWKERGRG